MCKLCAWAALGSVYYLYMTSGLLALGPLVVVKLNLIFGAINEQNGRSIAI